PKRGSQTGGSVHQCPPFEALWRPAAGTSGKLIKFVKTRTGPGLHFPRNVTVPSSAASSVTRRTTVPSDRITKMSVAPCPPPPLAISSLKPPRPLEKAIHCPSGDHAACASLPGLLVSRLKPEPSGRIT